MEPRVTHYRAADGTTLPLLADAILEAFPGRALPPLASKPFSFDRRYLDTVDGLFLNRGLCLVHEPTDGGHLMLIDATSGETVVALRPARCPRFAADLPPGPFADRIAAIAGYRALLPQASLAGTAIEITLRNREGKTVARVRLFEASLGGRPRTRRRPFGVRVEILPVRGYDKPEAMVEESLAKLLMLEPQEGSVPDAMFAALGARPGAAFPRGPVLFSPDLPAIAANRLILARLLTVLEINEKGVREDIDTEFLHDYRIAVRRTRTIVGTMKGALPPDFAALKSELRWLGQMTGPARDLDVYLLEFDRMAAAIPAEERGGLAPMLALLIRKRAAAYRKLARALKSERYRRIKQRWRGVLNHQDGDDANSRPIAVEAGRRIARLYRQAVREGRAITADSPPATLHELRKTCKKLRYLIEFFAHLYPEKRVKERIRELKQVQNNLGLYQDAHVQHDFVERLLKELEAEGAVAPETRQAMQHLAAERRTLQDRARKNFAEVFAAFATPEGAEAYRSLFETIDPGRDLEPLVEGVTE